jgi:hypothetical protein
VQKDQKAFLVLGALAGIAALTTLTAATEYAAGALAYQRALGDRHPAGRYLSSIDRITGLDQAGAGCSSRSSDSRPTQIGPCQPPRVPEPESGFLNLT